VPGRYPDVVINLLMLLYVGEELLQSACCVPLYAGGEVHVGPFTSGMMRITRW
jgi:hypothetical protein